MSLRKKLVSLLMVMCLVALMACNGGGNNSTISKDSSSEELSSQEDSSSVDSFVSSNIESSELEYSSSEDSVSSEDTTVESSEDTSVDSSVEESSEVTVDADFVNKVLSPKLNENLVWQYAGMQLFNVTDFKMSYKLAEKFKTNFEKYKLGQSVMLIELETGMTFAFDQDRKIGTASSIKGPFALYAYKCMEAGRISWDSQITYQERHFQPYSTGKVQNSPFGTKFSLKTLMDYMVRISDNQAYLMIKSTLGRSGFEEMMSQLGCSEIIPSGGNWGYITAKEMAAAWREIYYYSKYNENGAELFDRFMHAQYNYIWRTIPQYEAAHKSGWSGKAFNDAGVVFADGHEYVLVVLCGRNGVYDDNAKYQFQRITKLLAELMVEYNYYLENGKLMQATPPAESSEPDEPVINDSSEVSSPSDSSADFSSTEVSDFISEEPAVSSVDEASETETTEVETSG